MDNKINKVRNKKNKINWLIENLKTFLYWFAMFYDVSCIRHSSKKIETFQF